MQHAIVTGGQWGDEGKGKVIDILSDRFDVVVRYQGGNNAGHTVVINGRKFFLHLIPSGIFHPEKINVIGNGVVLDPISFLEEIKGLREAVIAVSPKNLLISDRVHLVMPYHQAIDQAAEALMGGKKIGTTGKGIGPAYTSKVMRSGIRATDFLSERRLIEKTKQNLTYFNYLLKGYYKANVLKVDYVIESILSVREQIIPYIVNSVYLLERFRNEGKSILFEGAQASLLDIDHGTYPFVTSSSVIAGAVGSGTGFSPIHIKSIMGVFKAYLTRVGSGPFPTEQTNGIGETLRQTGSEYGTTTGRPRRCGWFDVVVARYARIINGYTGIALTKLDVLSQFEEIPVCTGYQYKGEVMREFPAELEVLENLKPVYSFRPGWKAPITGVDRFDMLPEQAQDYVRFLEEQVQCQVLIVSTGPDRNQTVMMPGMS